MIYRVLTALAASFVALDADAAVVRLMHPYGELIDQGVITAHFEASYPDFIDCTIPPSVQRMANTFTIVARRVAPGATPPQCIVPSQVVLGELPAGWWTVILHVIDAPPLASSVEIATSEWRVQPPNTLCNRYPTSSAVIVAHRSLHGQHLAARIASDHAYAATLGNPIGVRPFISMPDATLYYPQLENPHDLRARLLATGEFTSASADGPVCLSPPPPDAFSTAIEYYHAGLGNYFYTAYPHEVGALDTETGAQGWARTGKSFAVLLQPGCPADRPEQAAYRFFGKDGVGPPSHVFTVDRAECRIVDKSGAWIYEGVAFWAAPASSVDSCALRGEIPLYRLWRPFGETNHRFTTERAVVDEMKAQGWIEEGVVMCVPR